MLETRAIGEELNGCFSLAYARFMRNLSGISVAAWYCVCDECQRGSASPVVLCYVSKNVICDVGGVESEGIGLSQ